MTLFTKFSPAPQTVKSIRRNRLRKHIGPYSQSWLKFLAPAEHELQVEQQPKINEVLERPTEDVLLSGVVKI